jgi:hypothetical protein
MRADEIGLSRRRIFAPMRVVDDLTDLNPNIAGPKRAFIALALVIIPAAREGRGRDEPNYV